MKKIDVYLLSGVLAGKDKLVLPSVEEVVEMIKEDIENNVNYDMKSVYTVEVVEMTNKQLEQLDEFDG